MPHPVVLVVGAGFIGSHICRHLVDAGCAVRALTRSASEPMHARLLAGTHVLLGDAADRTAVEAAMDGVDWVVFGAGGLVPAASQARPVNDVVLALAPLLTVLDAVAARTGTAFTYLSAGGTVYGQTDRELLRKDHATEPITSYGVLKLAGEKYTGMYGVQHAVPIRILRCANVYGEGQRTNRGQGVVVAFLAAVMSGAEIVLYGDGRVVRDFVYVGDVALAVDRLRPAVAETAAQSRVVNVGSGTGTSLAALLEAVEELLGRSAMVR